MEQLKPCPFCGKEPLCHYDGTAWHVRCNNDDCAMQPHVALWEKCHVVEAWNTRAPDEQVRKLQEALTAQCEWLRCQEGGEEYPAMGCECEPCIITRRVREALEDTK